AETISLVPRFLTLTWALGTAALLLSVTRPVIVARKSWATDDADRHDRQTASASNRWNFLFTISSLPRGLWKRLTCYYFAEIEFIACVQADDSATTEMISSTNIKNPFEICGLLPIFAGDQKRTTP